MNNIPVYIGKTRDVQRRYGEHYSVCSNENSNDYNKRLYTTIRQIEIDKLQFKTYIKINVIYSDFPVEYAGVMEDLAIRMCIKRSVGIIF